MQAFVAKKYTVILFEGPGQGQCLREGFYFRPDFEKPTSAVIDYFQLKQCAYVGISWGGYFALRSAAFDKRIVAAAAYDVLYDGFEVMSGVFPSPIRKILRMAYGSRHDKLFDALIGLLRKRSVLAGWGISQGLHITGTETPHALYQNLSRHTMRGITDQLTQHILLLAGESDHYIPLAQYYHLKAEIHHAKTLTCRLFTQDEGGEQHCQVGNYALAINTIMDWLDALNIATDKQE